MQSLHLKRAREFSLWQPVTVSDFRWLWLGQGVSLFGDQFYLVALPWLALQLTGSALALGTVLMVAGGARALFQLLGGALSDRFSPRMLMLVSNIVRAIVTAAITAIVFAGATRLWHLYLLSLVFGLVDAFFLPAYMSIVPRLVVSEYLAAGNALLRGTARFMALVGPATAGLIIATQNLGVAFAIDTATFMFAAASIWLMKGGASIITEGDRYAGVESGPAGLFRSIKEGLSYAWRHPLIRSLLFFVAAIEFSFVGSSSVGLAALAKQRFSFDIGATSLGWMMSSFGGGMLVGMLIAGSLKVARRRGRLVIGVTFMFGLGLAVLGIATHLIGACAILVFIGLGGGLANIVILALVQAKTDKRMLGRVMGLMMFAMSVLEPLSFAIAGLMADANLTLLFAASGAIILITSIASIGSTSLRTAD